MSGSSSKILDIRPQVSRLRLQIIRHKSLDLDPRSQVSGPIPQSISLRSKVSGPVSVLPSSKAPVPSPGSQLLGCWAKASGLRCHVPGPMSQSCRSQLPDPRSQVTGRMSQIAAPRLQVSSVSLGPRSQISGVRSDFIPRNHFIEP